MATLEPNDVLVLPEDEQPYEIDSSRGFQVTPNNYYSMAHIRRGLVGLGPGAVVRPSASGFHGRRQTYARGLQEKVLESRTHGAYLANFTMLGRDFGGIAYNATWASGTATQWERIYFKGAHRGWGAKPPTEAAAVCGYKGADMQISNCEIDCRDENGRSVGTSPLMWNAQSNVRVDNVFAHHAYAGMPTFWKVHNAEVNQLISTDGAQGLAFSPGVNVESSSGVFTFDNCTFFIHYGPKNRGLHLSVGGQTSSLHINVHNPTIDAGPWPGRFSIQEFSTTRSVMPRFDITRANGSAYPYRVAT